MVGEANANFIIGIRVGIVQVDRNNHNTQIQIHMGEPFEQDGFQNHWIPIILKEVENQFFDLPKVK